MTRQPTGTVVQLMGVLSGTFSGSTWDPWRAVLKAAFALELSEAERATVTELTKREVLPTAPVRELWLFIGRRSGKSIIAALQAVWATCCRSYRLAVGEVGIFMVLAADRKQARVIKRYISGLLHSHPALEALIANETADAIELTNGLTIEIHTCSYRSLRGYTCIGAAVDEVAFWQSEDSANPDREVLLALRAAMASQPEAMLVGLTTTYARRGEVWRIYEQHFGNDGSADVLVVNGPTRALNPTISQRIIDAAYEEDPIAAAAEFGGEFRRDVETYLSREALDAVVMRGRLEQPPEAKHHYMAFVDAAGGSGKDSMTLAIAHREGDQAVLDCVRETRPPFSPDATVEAFSTLLASYRITRLTGDRYAGSWPAERFEKHGVSYTPSQLTRSEIYQAFAPAVTSQRIELLDHPKVIRQLLNLERKTSRSGKDVIDHPPGRGSGSHDDLSNVVAGVSQLLLARQPPACTGFPIGVPKADPWPQWAEPARGRYF